MAEIERSGNRVPLPDLPKGPVSTGQRAELVRNRPKLVVIGDDAVSYQRRQRYIRALVSPFLRDGGYVKLNDKFYERP